MSDDNARGSTIDSSRDQEVAELRERVRVAELELAAIRTARRAPGQPIRETHRYAICGACGLLECYPVGRTLRGKGTAKIDPGRLENQACKGCRRKLGRYAHGRAKRAYPLLHERQSVVRAQRSLARHQRALAVAMDSRRARRTEETPVNRTSASALARGRAPAGHKVDRSGYCNDVACRRCYTAQGKARARQ